MGDVVFSIGVGAIIAAVFATWAAVECVLRTGAW